MEFPPLKNDNSEANMKLAAVVLAALMHCNVPEDAKAVTGTPSLAQIATLLRCSTRTIKRRMAALKEFGTVSTQARGKLSSVITLYQKRQRGQQLAPHDEGTIVGTASDIDAGTSQPLAGTTHESCGDNSDALRGQLSPLRGQLLSYSGITQDTSLGKSTQDCSGQASPTSPDIGILLDKPKGCIAGEPAQKPTAPVKAVPPNHPCRECEIQVSEGIRQTVNEADGSGFCQEHRKEIYGWKGEKQ